MRNRPNHLTSMSSEKIAQRACGDKRVLEEHALLYSMNLEAVPTFLQKFPIYPGTYFFLKNILKL